VNLSEVAISRGAIVDALMPVYDVVNRRAREDIVSWIEGKVNSLECVCPLGGVKESGSEGVNGR
jgi:hypothetical protein